MALLELEIVCIIHKCIRFIKLFITKAIEGKEGHFFVETQSQDGMMIPLGTKCFVEPSNAL